MPAFAKTPDLNYGISGKILQEDYNRIIGGLLTQWDRFAPCLVYGTLAFIGDRVGSIEMAARIGDSLHDRKRRRLYQRSPPTRQAHSDDLAMDCTTAAIISCVARWGPPGPLSTT